MSPPRLERYAHWLYLALAVPMVLWLALTVPAFQVADEPGQFIRAEQIRYGHVLPVQARGARSGGWSDSAVSRSMGEYLPLIGKPAAKIGPEAIQRSREVRWSGELVPAGASPTEMHGPLFHLPPAIGIAAGQGLEKSVIESLWLARVLNGLAACAVAFLAIRICAIGRPLMFLVLLLPMTLFQFASASQDALLIAGSCLGIAIAARAVAERRASTTLEFAAFTVILAAAIMARPPMLALAALLPLLGVHAASGPMRIRGMYTAAQWAWLCATMAIALLWTLASLALRGPDLHPYATIAPHAQLARLAEQPWTAIAVAFYAMLDFFSLNIYRSFIGVLGWLDTMLPRWYYWAAGGALLAAIVADAPSPRAVPRDARWLALAAFAGCVVMLYVSMYLVWTPVGAFKTEGIQGRYFLALAPLVPWFAGAWRWQPGPAIRRAAWYYTAAVALAGIGALPGVILERYYLP